MCVIETCVQCTIIKNIMFYESQIDLVLIVLFMLYTCISSVTVQTQKILKKYG